jgi:hypothetical protein
VGIMGRYVDGLPVHARDRLIEAQDWCVADVLGPDGARCLVGHAENWQPLEVQRSWWRSWMDGESGGLPAPSSDDADAHDGAGCADLEAVCSPGFFAFRRAHPADLAAYRRRVRRWGIGSESRIGARFDRLCARRGIAGAVRLVKARASRAFAPAALAPAAAG